MASRDERRGDDDRAKQDEEEFQTGPLSVLTQVRKEIILAGLCCPARSLICHICAHCVFINTLSRPSEFTFW